MSSTEHATRYEHYARECVRLAQAAKTAHEKDLLLQMAQTWRRLGERDRPENFNED